MPNTLVDSVTEKLLREDREILTSTQFPILTVSASYRDVVEAYHELEDGLNHPDVTFSRAHYSMALGTAITAWGSDEPQESKAWIVDPTNYVSKDDWRRVSVSATLGRLMARYRPLEWVKQNILDTFGRKSFPLADEITPPLLYLSEGIDRPIISFHIVVGNILGKSGKTIVQVVTDPHVREDYIHLADQPNMYYCVFDDNTRYDFLELAQAHGKAVDPNRVIVTGPPVDPRIAAASTKKKPTSWHRRPLRIMLTTGGIGTNKDELATILDQLLPQTRKRLKPIQIVYYAGTNHDHAEMAEELAQKHRVATGERKDRRAAFRVIYQDDIVDANNLLIEYGFPWADIVVGKPSGDMAYDAAAAGCALLFLRPWGEWELNVRSVFTQLGIGRIAEVDNIVTQIHALTDRSVEEPWLESALHKAHQLPPQFSLGTRNILHVARQTK